MPAFSFIRKRRQSEAANRQPQPVVDVEPLRVPSKLRSLLDNRRSGLFSRSTQDLRRAAGLQARGGLLPIEQQATTRTATVKIVPDVPSLNRQVGEPRADTNKEESVDGHSDGDNPNNPADVNLTTSNDSVHPPQRAEVTIMTPKPEPVGDAPTVAARRSVILPTPLNMASPVHSSHTRTIVASPDTTSPASTAFMTPPQRMSEDVAPPLFTSALDRSHSYDAAASPTNERRPSVMSNRSMRSMDGLAGSPRKLAPVILSPPMPLPIAHLPTTSPSSPHASWGDLARLGGPRSPALRTPGGTGFPFSLPPVAPAPAPDSTEELTDAEMQTVTRAMPVMARIASHRPLEPADDGGDVGDDDDDDDDSESEEGPSIIVRPPEPPNAKGKGVVRGPEDAPEIPRAQSSRARSGSALGLDLHDAMRRLKVSPTPSGAATPNESTAAEDDWDNDSDGHSELGTSATNTVIATPLTPSPVSKPPLFSHASKSMINLTSPAATSSTRPFLETVTETRSPAVELGSPDVASPRPEKPPLKRRLSHGDADPPPPRYEVLSSALFPGPCPKPREEEGRERLPPYWCGVHIEGTLSRKMEFTRPGMQARERAWKKYYFVLHGTALFVYKFDPTKVPLRAGEPYLACDENEIHNYLHVHPAPDRRWLHGAPVPTPPKPTATRAEKQARRNTISLEGALRNPTISAIAGRRGTIGSATPTTRDGGSSTPSDNRDGKNPDLFNSKAARRASMQPTAVASSTASAPLASHMPFAHNMLVHKYTLQGAESGLAADYKKRQHCVRIRAEGQQFMLQTETARQCVQWIEAFQAATNVALDLEIRPMPIQQTLPRRRRRPGQRRPPPPDPNAPPTSDNANVAFEDTPEGNIAAVEAAERAARERADHDRDRMLAEDQAANNGAFST